MDYSKIFEELLKDPSSLQVMLGTILETYKPALGVVVNTLFQLGSDLQNEYVSSNYPLASAKARKAKFDACVEAGFTPDQAMSLLLTDIRQVSTLCHGGLSKAASGIAEGASNA